MATRALVLLAALLAVPSALAQQVTELPTYTVRFPGGENATDTLRASIISVDAAKSETALKLACGEVSSRGCDAMNAATYRYSNAGFGLTITTTVTENRTATRNTAPLTTRALSLTYNCPANTNVSSMSCDLTSTVIDTVGNRTETSIGSEQSAFTTANNTARVTITAGSTQPTSSNMAVAQITQNAALAGAAIVALGGAMLL